MEMETKARERENQRGKERDVEREGEEGKEGVLGGDHRRAAKALGGALRPLRLRLAPQEKNRERGREKTGWRGRRQGCHPRAVEALGWHKSTPRIHGIEIGVTHPCFRTFLFFIFFFFTILWDYRLHCELVK